ncbi:MAG: hypothetical protein FWC99_03920 [Coriobacteriia bacterium]|nr:hypothetical protein [Coriobacteriia bacterium]
MTRLGFPYSQILPPWDIVGEVIASIEADSWLLVGGLMVQAHAMIAGLESRATVDVDMLIDVLSDTQNIERVINGLETLGFQMQEPAFRKSPTYRLKREDQIVDVLVAEHLSSGKRKVAKFGQVPLMEALGGAQAIDRKMLVSLEGSESLLSFWMPDLLGALVLKSAAYSADNRDRCRHLDDVALLASLITEVAFERDRLRGSDKKRLRSTWAVLEDQNHSAWLNLPNANRVRGHDVLRILTSL